MKTSKYTLLTIALGVIFSTPFMVTFGDAQGETDWFSNMALVNVSRSENTFTPIMSDAESLIISPVFPIDTEEAFSLSVEASYENYELKYTFDGGETYIPLEREDLDIPDFDVQSHGAFFPLQSFPDGVSSLTIQIVLPKGSDTLTLSPDLIFYEPSTYSMASFDMGADSQMGMYPTLSGIISRDEWNTSCPLDWNPAYFPVEKIVIHHTVGGDGISSLEEGKAYVNNTCRYHSITRGWGDIGYNFLIDQLGNVYEGRYGGFGVEGGHAYAANKGSIGISMIGTYTDVDITPAARNALNSLINELSERYNIDPTSTTTLSSGCYTFTTPAIVGHRDLSAYYQDGMCNDITSESKFSLTACPGNTFYPTIASQVRSDVSALAPIIRNVGEYAVYYYDNTEFSGTPVAVKKEDLGTSFTKDFGGESPLSGIAVGSPYSIAYFGNISVSNTAVYTLSMSGDDGYRVYVDNTLQIDGESGGDASKKIGLEGGVHQVRIEFWNNSAEGLIRFSLIEQSLVTDGVASYYSNGILKGPPFVVPSGEIDYDWGTGTPISAIGTDYFSARYDTETVASTNTAYLFQIKVDDRVKLYVDSLTTPVFSRWSSHVGSYGVIQEVGAGTHKVRAEYMEERGDANFTLQKSEASPDAVHTISIEEGGTYAFSIDKGTNVQMYIDDLEVPFLNGGSVGFIPLTVGDHDLKITYDETSSATEVVYSYEKTSNLVFSSPGGVVVQDSTGEDFFTVGSNVAITVSYANTSGWYSVSDGSIIKTTQNPVYLSPKGTDYPYVEAHSKEGTYNQYRGTLIIKAVPSKDALYTINRINVEDYLKGLGETGLQSNLEYTKALITAARTYVIYHYQNGGKHPVEGFTLDATANDQVYYGYEYETYYGTDSNLTKAVDATKGKVITHPESPYLNKIIPATYYSQTGQAAETCGRTKTDRCTWNTSEWYWIPENGVADPWWKKDGTCFSDNNDGRTGAGHGYGMSGSGALCFATEEGMKWDEILLYFYSGVKDGGSSSAIVSYPSDTSDLMVDIAVDSAPFAVSTVSKLPSGVLVKTADDPTVWLLKDGLLRGFRTQNEFLSHDFQWDKILILSEQEIEQYPFGPVVNIQSGTLVKSPNDPTVFLIIDGGIYGFQNPEVFLGMGYSWDAIMELNQGEVSNYTASGLMEISEQHFPSTKVKTANDATVFLLEKNADEIIRRPMPSPSVFFSYGWDWVDVVVVSESEMGTYQDGPVLFFRDGTVIAKVGTSIESIQNNSATVYAIEYEKKRPFRSYSDFTGLGFRDEMISFVPESEFNAITDGNQLIN